MPHQLIDSLTDPRLAPYLDIRHRDPVENSNRFVAEGKLVVQRLLESSYPCQSILVEAGHHEDLMKLAATRTEPPEILSADLATLRQIVGFPFHRGILACGIHPAPKLLKDLPTAEANAPPILVVCGINNPENIGGLMRTAAAFGVRRFLTTGDSAHPFSRRALRVSMAAALTLEFFRFDCTATEARFLSEQLGYRTIATALSPSAQPLANFQPDSRPLAIFVGSEGEGLAKSIQQAADDLLIIPMSSGVDSLNANVATAIFLYHVQQLANAHK